MPQPTTNSVLISHPDSAVSEAYRTLRFNLDYSFLPGEVRTVAVTSAGRGEGKTTTALNLAIACAQVGKQVMLVDADLRKPSLHHAFGGSNARGLANVLAQQLTAQEVIRPTAQENLSLMTAGPAPSNPSDLLASKAMSRLLTELRDRFDLVIVDSPPMLELTDGRLLAASTDGVVLVAEHGKLKRTVARKLRDDLAQARARLLGVVLNKTKGRRAGAYLYR